MLNEIQPQTHTVHRRFDTESGRIVQVRDYSRQTWRSDDEKDFHIRTLEDEKLIDSVPQRDDNFQEEMFDLSEADDMPESDRVLDCRARGLNRSTCYGRG